MQRSVWFSTFEYDQDTEYQDYVGFGQVPHAYFESFISLHGRLMDLFSGEESPAEADYLAVSQKILNLHPRLDAPGKFGVDIRSLDETTFVQLLLTNGKITDAEGKSHLTRTSL